MPVTTSNPKLLYPTSTPFSTPSNQESRTMEPIPTFEPPTPPEAVDPVWGWQCCVVCPSFRSATKIKRTQLTSFVNSVHAKSPCASLSVRNVNTFDAGTVILSISCPSGSSCSTSVLLVRVPLLPSTIYILHSTACSQIRYRLQRC